jgi:hypothetical protein
VLLQVVFTRGSGSGVTVTGRIAFLMTLRGALNIYRLLLCLMQLVCEGVEADARSNSTQSLSAGLLGALIRGIKPFFPPTASMAEPYPSGSLPYLRSSHTYPPVLTDVSYAGSP